VSGHSNDQVIFGDSLPKYLLICVQPVRPQHEHTHRISQERILAMNIRVDPARYNITTTTSFSDDIDLDTEVVHDLNGVRITEAATEAFTVERARSAGRPSLTSKTACPHSRFIPSHGHCRDSWCLSWPCLSAHCVASRREHLTASWRVMR